MRSPRTITLLALLAAMAFAVPALAFDVTFGMTWEGPGYTLQDVLDQACMDWGYGPGCVDAATGYEGYLPGDADIPYWFDEIVDGIVVRELAGYANTNTMGWYVETEGSTPPVIDGIDDGVIFTGPMQGGDVAMVNFGMRLKFGLWLNPNGPGDSTNALEPEKFFTNRYYNDIGPDGSTTFHPPYDGDPQALIYNVSHLFNGQPSFVVAWEDLDSGSELAPAYAPFKTDNDFNDLVVLITATSPVPTETVSFGAVKSLYRQ